MHRLLRKHRSFLLFVLMCVPLAAAFCAIWTGVTGQYRPPFWATVVAAVVTGLVADRLERVLTNYLDRDRRGHVEGPRPTNPDGSPFRYHQIVDGGWEYCDGCHMWGQGWTPVNPHQCQKTYVKGPVTDRKASR